MFHIRQVISVCLVSLPQDIRRSIQGNLRPLVTSIPASSMYSVRSGSSSKSRTVSASDSPLATSSTTSSEPSVNTNSMSYDGSGVEENDFACERGNSWWESSIHDGQSMIIITALATLFVCGTTNSTRTHTRVCVYIYIHVIPCFQIDVLVKKVCSIVVHCLCAY